MLPVIPLSAPALGLLEFDHLLRDGLTGVGIGVIGSRIVISRTEQGGDALPGRRIRQIELAWTLAGAVLGMIGSVAVRVVFT